VISREVSYAIRRLPGGLFEVVRSVQETISKSHMDQGMRFGSISPLETCSSENEAWAAIARYQAMDQNIHPKVLGP